MMFNIKPKKALVEQLLSSWGKHQRSLLLLLNELPEEAMAASLATKKGWNIAEQFWHLHKVRMQHLEDFMKKQDLQVTKEWNDEINKKNIERALDESSRILYQYLNFSLKEKKSKAAGFKDGILGFFTYLISHEAHHKGCIMLIMKHNGFELSEDLECGLWDWDKL